MAEKSSAKPFSGGATPTVTTKKNPPPGKKKVIRRLVKNAKTGEILKTEIVRIDINGETTVTSYPAGTPVPSLGALQAASSAKKPLQDALSVAKKDTSASTDSVAKGKQEGRRSDVGPSVPVDIPGLDDLLERENELMKAKKQATETEKSSPEKKLGEDGLESALISIMKRKRHRDPKARRRGLVASTMSRRADSDEDADNENQEFSEDKDYRNMQTNVDEEEEIKKRKERHRRRREKRHRDRPVNKDNEPNDSGVDAVNDQRPYDPEDEEHELHPLEEAELLAKQLQASASIKQQEQEEPKSQETEENMDDAPSPMDDKPPLSDISDDDADKRKKKKKKHKNKKKKKKRQKHRSSGPDDDASGRSDGEKRSADERSRRSSTEVGLKKEDIDRSMRNRTRSRSSSHSFTTLSLSSISSAFSDSFDFAGAAMPMGDFTRGGFRGGFRGRGNFVPFRGRAGFRGFPRGMPRGAFRGAPAFPGMFPEGMDPMMGPMFMGPAGRGMWRGGPWGPMMGPGRGGFNNFDDGGIGIYVEGESDRSRSRSYSSYSSYSSRSRSRSRRRHRRRHHSSSRSYSSYSRSSRSYSRSYSRSSRSYSRSYSRSTSRSYSSYSRSRSRSRSKAAGWSSSGGSRRGSPNFRNIYSQGAVVQETKQDEEVPWWAEFDKTYEIQKNAEKEAMLKDESDAKERSEGTDQPATKLQGTSYDFSDMTSDDIDVVRCLMSVIDKACHQQDPVVEDARRCVDDMIDEVCSSPRLQCAEDAANDCLEAVLDEVCPGDPITIARLKKQTADLNAVNFPDVSDKSQNKLLRCYTIACHVTEQTRAMRRQAKMLESTQDKSDDEKDSGSDVDRRHDDRKGRHGRKRRKTRRRRRHGRSYSRSSSSSTGSEKKASLVNLTAEQQQSLQQAQQMLILQQQQLQAAGILPKSLAIPKLPHGIPSLIPTSNSSVPEPEVLSNRWDKDMDNLLKTKSKDDITRKLMQRMKEKKQLGDGDLSPVSGKYKSEGIPAEKVFSGSGNLKSRKIAISSIDKSKVFGKDLEEMGTYKKSDIAAAQASIEFETSRENERSREQEQREKLTMWSDEQKGLKEEVKRKMREEIEKAERAKKEKLKEQMLEEEKQKEIVRIREEVREQIKKEIRDEIEKQRKQVLEDPELKSQLMELEALRQSKVPKSESAASKAGVKPLEESFVMQQDKHKQEMNSWLEEQCGKRASDMSVDEMRRMQMVYMEQLQHWSQQQQKTYMQWYWHQQQHYQQHNQHGFNQQGGFYNQRNSNEQQQQQHSSAGNFTSRDQGPRFGMGSHVNPGPPQDRGTTFTHAPSKGPQSNEMEGTIHSMPPRGLMSSHTDDHRQPPQRNTMQPPPPFVQQNQFNIRRGMQDEMRPQHPNQPIRGPRPHPPQRFNAPNMQHQPDMSGNRRPFPDRQDSNQAPMHQYPPADFDSHPPDGRPGPGMPGMQNRFGRQPFDQHGNPMPDQQRPQFDGHGPPRLDQQGRPIPGNQQGRPGPMDQQGRPGLMDQLGRPGPMDQQGRSGPMGQQGRPGPMDQQGRPGPVDQQGRPGPVGQQGRPLLIGQPPQLDQQGRPILDQQGHPVSINQQGQPTSMGQQIQPAPINQNQFGQAIPSMDQPGLPPRLDQHGRPIADQPHNIPPQNQFGHQHIRHPVMSQHNAMPIGQTLLGQPPMSMHGLVPNQSGPIPGLSGSGVIAGNDQPPPPGVEAPTVPPTSKVAAPPGVEDIAPPGEENAPASSPPAVKKQVEEDTPTKSSKKKKKKHRKHKKRRDRSSSSENDDDTQRIAIMEQLKALQAVEEGEVAEVEDGEVQSDDDKKPSAIAAAAALLKQLESKKRKKHKKRKKRRRESSSDEAEESPATQAQTEPPAPEHRDANDPGIPPPPFFREASQNRDLDPHRPPSVQLGGSHENQGLGLSRLSDAGLHMQDTVTMSYPPPEHQSMEEQRKFPGPPREFNNSPYAPHIQQPPERYSLPPQGAGEPHSGGPLPDRGDHFTHYIGPGGDHTFGQNQPKPRPGSPMLVGIPENPREMEMWARRMEEKYTDEKSRPAVKPLMDFSGRKVEKIPSLMDKYIPEPEPRRIAALGTSMRGARRDFPHGGRQHPDDDRIPGQPGRKRRDRGGRGRPRKRRRGGAGMPPRTYHDWDQPADDGLIYYYSGSEHSSGWGSDKDFDEMLAKKKRETIPARNEQDMQGGNLLSAQPIHVTNTRRPSPARREPFPSWERPSHMNEPQGIPVIGGSKPPKPQPIPSLANRGGPPLRNEYDHLGRPVPREDEFKMSHEYFSPSDQQRMLNPPSWDHPPGGANRDVMHIPGRGGEMMRDRMEPLRRPY